MLYNRMREIQWLRKADMRFHSDSGFRECQTIVWRTLVKKHMEDYHEAPRGIFSLLLALAYTMTFAWTSAIAVLGDA